ncbi:hypothetical protein SCLCIDRAFT_1210160 [Scleroderma citrinum Foug A]|uniref:Uncharacterized protein n=1 Tax=Scleroderma citrinum Foug A TaxID=1036808 RepID=A0A0C3EHT5_9AGAM|nr:hypothetical protein SCLCIDRAFT_1210160 [Scleroderma citrinum Foug A]
MSANKCTGRTSEENLTSRRDCHSKRSFPLSTHPDQAKQQAGQSKYPMLVSWT